MKTRRGSKIKITLSEKDIIRGSNDYLQIKKNQRELMFIRNNSGAFPIDDGKNKRRYIRFGDKGSSDFIVWMPFDNEKESGFIPFNKWVRLIAIEAKSDTGKQSKDQKEWQSDFEAIGGEYYIVRSVDRVINIIEGR